MLWTDILNVCASLKKKYFLSKIKGTPAEGPVVLTHTANTVKAVDSSAASHSLETLATPAG